MTLTDLSFANIHSIALSFEHLESPRAARAVLELDGTELALRFAPTDAGLQAWAQLRQGLERTDSYTLNIDGANIPAPQAEQAITNWLFLQQRSRTESQIGAQS